MDTCCQTGRETDSRKPKLIVLPFIGIIRFYRYFLSPWLGNQCRFSPSCSQYAEAAFEAHGVFKGLVFSMWRILRCNPWSKGGYDPIPPQHSDYSPHSD